MPSCSKSSSHRPVVGPGTFCLGPGGGRRGPGEQDQNRDSEAEASRRRRARHDLFPRPLRTAARGEGFGQAFFRPASRQNCVSFSSVIRWPFSRRRLISSSFRPASLPAAWSGFGLPRTTTVVFADGAPWIFAPARRAARAASMRGRLEDAGEGHVRALERAQAPDLERGGRMGERVDQLRGALVALAALADAAVDDLLQVVGAAEAAHFAGADAGRGASLHEHSEQLADLVDVVARLPLGGHAREDVARNAPRVQRARGDAAPVALVADDAEVAELQGPALADEDVHRREIPVEHLAAVELAEHFEDAGDLAARGPLGPALPGAVEVRAQVAVPRVLEGEAVEDAAVLARQRKRVEDADRALVAREELAEVGLLQPAVDVHARLDRDDGRDREGAGDAGGEVGLAEASLAEEAVDAVLEPRLGALDDLLGKQQRLAARRASGGGHPDGGGPGVDGHRRSVEKSTAGSGGRDVHGR